MKQSDDHVTGSILFNVFALLTGVAVIAHAWPAATFAALHAIYWAIQAGALKKR